jgi:hypothetical protein
MLLGFRDNCFEVENRRMGSFYLSADVLQRNVNLRWRFILVYGPSDHARTDEFLGELQVEVEACQLALVVGGYFNLVSCLADKSNGVVNWPRVRDTSPTYR